MAEELGRVLREVSALLQRLTEQNDAETRRREEDRSRWDANREQREEASKRLQSFNAGRPDPKKQAEEMKIRMEESRVLHAKQRDQDVQFREQLLQEIQRHNQLLETLIEKLAERPPL
jgi:hypothetical protein